MDGFWEADWARRKREVQGEGKGAVGKQGGSDGGGCSGGGGKQKRRRVVTVESGAPS